MCKACHACGAELTNLVDCKRKDENDNSLRVEGGDPIRSCKFCGEKYAQESLRQGDISPSATPLISSALTSTNSFVSSCSEFSVDANLYGRSDQDEVSPDSSQEDHNLRLIGHMQNLSFSAPVNGIDRSSTIVVEYFKDINNEKNTYTEKDLQIMGPGNGPEVTEDSVHSTSGSITSFNKRTELSQSFDSEMDARVWVPPEPEDPEDDIEGSVANNDDDDDECSDGMKWGQPSSLSSFGKEGSGSYRFKEERQKAMAEVMNGEFRALVSKLLTSVGIAFSGEDGENWIDIVTSLSWEAALLVKPDAVEGKEMDPERYVKVKCIATGSRSQCQVIKGMVFKKNAAHRHMPTKYKKPRLLLLQGMLGQHSSGLSSFDSMEQEEDNLKFVIEKIEMCHPNVVLVEKSVSRDVQESLITKGITVVFDMKLHRLERVARCTGSQIISSVDSLMSQKLKHCDSFHFEKFVLEHGGCSEGGKKPRKTLMFLEGCPRPLGCTILLKGTHSDELKKIKCVVQCVVVVAYHLILDTSFLIDQRSMLSTIHSSGVVNKILTGQQLPIVGSGSLLDTNISRLKESLAETDLSCTVEISTSDGFCEERSPNLDLGLKDNSTLSGSSPDVNSYGNGAGEPDSHITAVVPITTPEAQDHCEMKANDSANGVKTPYEQAESLSSRYEVPLETCKSDANSDDQIQYKDDISAVLDAHSILVLMSSQNILSGTVCEHNHFSRIKYYRNFDIPLGRFLQDNLLNQRHQCSTCGESPGDHAYYYTHHIGRIMVRVKRISMESCLPGEAEGKLWMWSRCLKCNPENGIPKYTKRVLISTVARGLSFGKFLELSFSNQSTSSRLFSCGHSLHRDCLRFYGLGTTVAMFRYSPLAIYAASMPPQILGFNNPIRQDWLKTEADDVHRKGMLMFAEVTYYLQKIGSQFSSSLPDSPLNNEIFKVEDLLRQEKSEFEEHFQRAIDKSGNPDQAVWKLLSLNRILWKLLLESYVWDRRLDSLHSSNSRMVTTADKTMHEEQLHLQQHGKAVGRIEGRRNILYNGDKVSDNSGVSHIAPIINNRASLSSSDDHAGKCGTNLEAELEIKLKETSTDADEITFKEIQVSEPLYEGLVLESGDSEDAVNIPIDTGPNERTTVGCSNLDGLSHDECTESTTGRILDDCVQGQDSSVGPFSFSANLPSCSENFQDGCLPISDHLQDQTIPVTTDLVRHTGSVSDLNPFVSTPDEISTKSGFNEPDLDMYISQDSLLSNLDVSEESIWTPFSEIWKAYMKDLQGSYPHKFELINSYTPAFLSSVYQLITQEGSRMHIPIGPDDNVVSVYEGEYSSIIACALALLQCSGEALVEKEITKEKEGEANKVIELPHSLSRIFSMASSHWTASLDIEGIRSAESVSLEESCTSSLDGLNVLDSPLSSGTLHPEIHLRFGKLTGKGKYSVICVYANQFRALRRRCCPCELNYIASLSRCKNWDAKGGKSKSFFAKTLDDRFIIKEIQKTELDSFSKFAPEYFKHMNQSFNSGSQTCLAKILGIYQVIIRQTKSGKEMKHDLMVMENLTFGRNITRVYDLKGALHARYTSASDGSGTVLLDQNFVNDMQKSPLYISGKTKCLLLRAVWNDTSFLTVSLLLTASFKSINVMDYSLLVGVDTQRCELVYGIIDYLREYTWDKHLETWVKASLVPKNVSPTVISPKEYKKRFRKFMSMHILSFPDHCCPERFSESCNFCANGSDHSSQLKTTLQRETN
ncbi:hypothetical protein HHK36_004394 [Tetracentron sinense]|uniref:1-phosphatidylinositol-3-phosphate 5-kinase n=1 Tax=Tetracentron sinense TaxID=13715 RepID=A0A834ZUU1_TETSI|nr:hypothetical protein HHK36_004394 [Tetracentron sinense]